jgi:hypothetical protein
MARPQLETTCSVQAGRHSQEADFPQGRHEEQDVVYLRGDQLQPWLSELSQKMTAPQRSALVTAIQEVRASLNSAS